MPQTLEPFAPAEDVLLDLLIAGFPDDIKGSGTQLADVDAEHTPFVLAQRVGGPSTRLNSYPLLDLEVFAPTRAAAVSLSERISAFLLGYPRSVETGGRFVVIDMVEETRPPVELPWDDNMRRIGATYQISVRR